MNRYTLLVGAVIGFSSQAAVVTEPLTYQVDGQEFKGYLAFDDSLASPVPGVLVVHEWWGQNDYVRLRAEMLAELGYVALALDMYGDGKQTGHPEEAGAFAKASLASLPLAERRFNAAREVLAGHPRVAGSPIAAVGYCYGGGVVLHMARSGAPLAAVASFHGSLTPKADPLPAGSNIRIAVFNGAADPMVPGEQVAAFRQEMDAAQADYLLVNYPGALHAFTNPDADRVAAEFNIPVGYNQAADQDSWRRLQDFLQDSFE
ncbi:dienelactone hydrolase family protein [Oceanisphaera psychrotolerans]|uniref:Dienelactone hydrolase n=1 Tax=Oceanisphaera psychrotolerans TaxID=1414654 RepID=A0A1J4Q9A2_9GAMM|nr:dienelactone hydrolase family protein [Oceanisphaera psychrotolerans]OIN04322.1 dienelactone hydrolase [Oceanisphaera psychrotolerans]